jgi:hypothetical protein
MRQSPSIIPTDRLDRGPRKLAPAPRGQGRTASCKSPVLSGTQGATDAPRTRKPRQGNRPILVSEKALPCLIGNVVGQSGASRAREAIIAN